MDGDQRLQVVSGLCMTSDHFLPLPVKRFSTHGVAEKEKFDLWRDTVQQIHDLELPEDASPKSFEADVGAWSLGALAVAGGHFTERRMLRGERITRRLQLDQYRILLPLDDTIVRHTAGDRRRVVRRGQMIFSDLARPEEADCGTGRLMQFIIARDTLDGLLASPRDLHGFVPEGPLASLVTDHLVALVQKLPELGLGDAVPVAQATLQLIAATAGAAQGPSETIGSALDMAKRQRILRHIDKHLLEPGLSQDVLSVTFGISRASLYRLFQSLGGVAAYIQERKLHRLRAELAKAGPHHLGDLTWKYGFSSQGQMSRAFRAQFGHAPRDTQPGIFRRTEDSSSETILSFDEILRALQ
jgi:AraC-like DNA-binding protein